MCVLPKTHRTCRELLSDPILMTRVVGEKLGDCIKEPRGHALCSVPASFEENAKVCHLVDEVKNLGSDVEIDSCSPLFQETKHRAP
jgi:hypothetical protein